MQIDLNVETFTAFAALVTGIAAWLDSRAKCAVGMATEKEERVKDVAALEKKIAQVEMDSKARDIQVEEGSKTRAAGNAALIRESEGRLHAAVEALGKSRNASDQKRDSDISTISVELHGLTASVGELKGSLETFIGEYRSNKNGAHSE